MRRKLVISVAFLVVSFVTTSSSRAEVPSDLFGRWSTDPNSCIDDPGPGVTVLSIDAAEVGWYEYGCSIIRSTPSADGVNLAIDCVKGGGSQYVGNLNIRSDGWNRIIVDSNVGGLGDSFRRCDRSRHASPKVAGGRTLWFHNGSTMYLIAKGTARDIYYHQPRAGMLQAGAAPTSLFFNGQVVDGTYVGIARIFKRGCGQFPYRVSGPILEGGRRIRLVGAAPIVDGQCRVVTTKVDQLDFELIEN
jgi:hypothetical protein